MKILVASDFHLHPYKAFGHNIGHGISKRLYEQKLVLQQILDLCEQQHVELLVFPGDLFHQAGEIPTEALNIADWFFEELRELNVSLVTANGNHDLTKRIDAQSVHSALSVFNGDNVSEYCKLNKIYRLGYDEDVNEKDIKGYDLVIVHKDLNGEQYGGHVVENGIDWKPLAENNKWVVCGHIHAPKVLADNCFIVGAPMHFNFGDQGDRGVWTIDLEANHGEFIPLSFPKFITVEKREDIVKDDGNYYRLLGCKDRVDDENVITVIEPEVFKERIKESSFEGILKEWVSINKRDPSVFEVVTDTVGTVESKAQKVFKGKIEEVVLHNFLSFEEARYEIKKGFTLVNGSSDEFSSNGSGKSTLVSEALLWCLFGETSKGLKGDDVIRTGEKDCDVTLALREYTSKTTTYVIKRSRKEGLSVTVINDGDVNEITKGKLLKQAQELLENEVLGFNLVTFKTACLFSQEQLMMLTGLSDTEKTNMITSLLGFEQYDGLYEKVVKSIEDTQVEIEKDTKAIQDIGVNVSLLENSIKHKEDEKKEIELKKGEVSNRIAQYENEIAAYLLEKPQSAPPVSKDFQKDLLRLETEVEDTDKKIEEVDKQIVEFSTLKQDICLKLSEKRSAQTYLTQTNKTLSLQVSESLHLDVGGICPTCGAVMSEDAKKQHDEELKGKLADGEKKLLDVSLEKEKLDKKYSVIDDELSEMQHTKKTLKLLADKAKNEIRSIQIAHQQYEMDVRNYEKKQAEQSKFVDTKKALIAELLDAICVHDTKIEKTIKSVDEYKQLIDMEKKGVEVRNESIDKSNKKINDLQFWQTAFSSKGIKSVLLDRFCNTFNRFVNRYLSLASGGRMSLTMTPTKSLKSGEERNKIGMDIFNNGVTRKYESLSGGEKRRVDFALCLGMNRFISEQHGLENGLLGVIVFDELFSFLDSMAFEDIGTLLAEEGKTKALYVIVHGNGLESYSDNFMNIVKEKGISRIV